MIWAVHKLNFSQKIGPAVSAPAKQKRILHINMEQVYIYIFCLSKLKKITMINFHNFSRDRGMDLKKIKKCNVCLISRRTGNERNTERNSGWLVSLGLTALWDSILVCRVAFSVERGRKKRETIGETRNVYVLAPTASTVGSCPTIKSCSAPTPTDRKNPK